jgi:hypothetical protein
MLSDKLRGVQLLVKTDQLLGTTCSVKRHYLSPSSRNYFSIPCMPNPPPAEYQIHTFLLVAQEVWKASKPYGYITLPIYCELQTMETSNYSDFWLLYTYSDIGNSLRNKLATREGVKPILYP